MGLSHFCALKMFILLLFNIANFNITYIIIITFKGEIIPTAINYKIIVLKNRLSVAARGWVKDSDFLLENLYF